MDESEKLKDERLKFAYNFFIENRGEMPEAYKRIGQHSPDLLFGFTKFYKAVTSPGALSQKVKELIIIAIETATRGPNHELHARKAIELGATPEEIHEAVALAFLWAGMETYVGHGTPLMDYVDKIWAERKNRQKK